MIAYLARIELRRRWRSMLLLAALAAVVVGTVLTAVAGARRADSSFDRYLASMHPPDVAVFGDDRDAIDEAGALPQVARSGRIELAAIVPTERPDSAPTTGDLGTLGALGISRAGRWAGIFAPRAASLRAE